jgi:TAT (twin-arginine translocation) pathway signal sequence
MFVARSSAVTVRPLEPGHRHAPSRRQFLAAGAGLGAAGVLGTQVIGASPALAARHAGDPRPIPGGTEFLAPDNTELFHVFAPGAGEPNSITDFNGFVGVAHITGTGAGANANLSFDVDNRFITGEYIALNGQHANATFGFL